MTEPKPTSYTIRLPRDLLDAIAKAAKSNDRSAHAEIVRTLRMTYAPDAQRATTKGTDK